MLRGSPTKGSSVTKEAAGHTVLTSKPEPPGLQLQEHLKSSLLLQLSSSWELCLQRKYEGEQVLHLTGLKVNSPLNKD